MVMKYVGSGKSGQDYVTFFHVPGAGGLPALALCALTARRRRIGRLW